MADMKVLGGEGLQVSSCDSNQNTPWQNRYQIVIAIYLSFLEDKLQHSYHVKVLNLEMDMLTTIIVIVITDKSITLIIED